MVLCYMLFFSSCKKEEIDLEALYMLLPSIELGSVNYTVNDQLVTEKKIFNPPSTRTGEKKPLELKYQGKTMAVIGHTSTNTTITVFAIDTEIGDILSVFESCGTRNQLTFIDGKQISIQKGYSLVGVRADIKEKFFILLFKKPGSEQYIMHRL